MDKKCSVIIPTKDKLSRLYLTLKCLEPQVTAEVEVIVVFDGCEESTIKAFFDMSFSFEPVCVICKENVGRAAARNRGLEKAQGDVIIFLDDDRLTESDFIRKHLNYHERQACVVLGERMDLSYKEEDIKFLMSESTLEEMLNKVKKDSKKEFYYNIKKIFLRYPYHKLRYIAFITGNVSIDRKILNEVNGFDESFKGWGYEDTDLGYRLSIMDIPYISDYTIVCYHILHSHVKSQKSKEELKNLRYFKRKFMNDYKLGCILMLYQIKALLQL